MKKVIKSDLYHISYRLKCIDPKYFLVFDTVKRNFEVHYKGTRDTYCFRVETRIPDSRTLKKVYDTHIRNAKKIFDEIDRYNAKLDRIRESDIHDMCDYKIREIVHFDSTESKTSTGYFENIWY